MKIADMTPSERPAERACEHGVRSLSNVELLTLALGASDTATAENLLTAANGSLRRTVKVAETVKGIGPAKALHLSVSVEIGRRVLAEAHEERLPIRSPSDVVALMAPAMEDLLVEELHVLLLDSQHRLQGRTMITRGILNSSLVHPREVFRFAITEGAAAMIVVHNHPSGDSTPSHDDRAITDQLIATGRLLDIPVHDHVIIGKGRYTSFAETGLI